MRGLTRQEAEVLRRCLPDGLPPAEVPEHLDLGIYDDLTVRGLLNHRWGPDPDDGDESEFWGTSELGRLALRVCTTEVG